MARRKHENEQRGSLNLRHGNVEPKIGMESLWAPNAGGYRFVEKRETKKTNLLY